MNLSELKGILKTEGLHLSRKRGQNFLTDSNIMSSLIKTAKITQTDSILEIGTGLGALTELLLATHAKIVSFEIDRGVYEAVSQRLGNRENLKLIHEDFLKSDFQNYFDKPFRVFANIPYHIATQILIRLWFAKERLLDIYVLVQKEVGLRLTAKNAGKETGFLSVLLQLEFELKILKQVPRGAFFPVPEVDSVYLSLTPRPSNLMKEDREPFFQFIKKGFSEKRKQLLPRLRKEFPGADSIFSEMNLDPFIRPEKIEPQRWLELFQRLHENPKRLAGASPLC